MDSKHPTQRDDARETTSVPASRLPSLPSSLPPRPKSPEYFPPAGQGISTGTDSPRRRGERSPRRWDDDRRRDGDRVRDFQPDRDGLDRVRRRDREERDRERDRRRNDPDRYYRPDQDGDRERDCRRAREGDRGGDRDGGREHERDRRDDRPMRRDLPPHVMPPFRGTLNDDRSRSSTPRPYRSGPNSPHAYGGPDLKARREEREQVEFSIWPPSPERPYAELEAERNERAERSERRDRDRDRDRDDHRSKKKSRRRRYDSDESEDERERRRRRRKEKERRRDREDEDRSERRRERDRDDEWEERRSRSPKPSRSRRSSTRSRSRSLAVDTRDVSSATPAPIPEDDEGPEVGPQPPSELQIAGRFEREAGKNLLPGEAAAMRQYVESGQRIPRRGEIGLDQNKIMQYEASGFVMSGSRNARMNAVRVRKETQVVNAQDKIDLMKTKKEEADRKEGEIISQFREMVEERLREEERKRRDRA